jgi:hypothetical protein
MTLQDVSRLSSYARKHPPLRVLVGWCAQALGVEMPDPNKKPPKYLTAEEFKKLVQMTGGRVPGVGMM